MSQVLLVLFVQLGKSLVDIKITFKDNKSLSNIYGLCLSHHIHSILENALLMLAVLNV